MLSSMHTPTNAFHSYCFFARKNLFFTQILMFLLFLSHTSICQQAQTSFRSGLYTIKELSLLPLVPEPMTYPSFTNLLQTKNTSDSVHFAITSINTYTEQALFQYTLIITFNSLLNSALKKFDKISSSAMPSLNTLSYNKTKINIQLAYSYDIETKIIHFDAIFRGIESFFLPQ